VIIATTEVAECVGGPLDGQFASAASAFPWPCGWYYLRRVRDNRPETARESLRALPSDGVAFVWNGEPGHYTSEDARRHQSSPHHVSPAGE
jgi:hypothetical protein